LAITALLLIDEVRINTKIRNLPFFYSLYEASIATPYKETTGLSVALLG
jgi:hypothetical protein